MISSIVVGFDGTPAAFAALNWVAMRAQRHATRVEIVAIAGSILEEGIRTDASIIEAERYLRGLAPDVDIAPWRFTGHMADPLYEHASAADLLVVGSHRGQSLRCALAGRLPMRTASGSRVPVLVVPDDWSAAGRPIVVGLDDDDSSEVALKVAAEEADASGLPLLVVHAWGMPAPRTHGSTALLESPVQEMAGHRTILRRAVNGIRLLYPAVHVEELLVEASPGTALIDVARDASLIVIGTHHRGIVAGAMLGSVVQDVLSQSAVPVCVVRSDHVTRGLGTPSR